MTDTMELARRAVACKGWRWLPGMLAGPAADPAWLRLTNEEWAVCSGPYLGTVLPPEAGSADGWSRGWSMVQWSENDYLPDLTDHATVGCLLALVREAWSDPMLFAFPDAFPDRWTVVNVDCGHHATEVAALVAALEAAQ